MGDADVGFTGSSWCPGCPEVDGAGGSHFAERKERESIFNLEMVLTGF